jgi:hypothetical protein
MVQEKKLTSIRLGKGLYAELQKKAKAENRSVNNYIETALIESLHFYEPNDETIAAVEESRAMIKNGTGKAYSNVDGLIKDLLDE